MNQVKQWLSDHHGAVLAAIVVVQNSNILHGFGKILLNMVAGAFAAA